MTSDFELCFLETYAREGFSGKGQIVDLGCWLGATTIGLARGLENNPVVPRQRWIDAIDLFVWDQWLAEVAQKRRFAHSLQSGDDYRECVRQLLGSYEAWVNLKKLDLAKETDGDEPIEFLFIDAMKSWQLADRITRNYFPRMLPAESYLVQQDFAFHLPSAATIHLTMWFLRDYFEWVHHVPRSASVAYRCKKAVVADDLPRFTENFFALEEVNEAYDYSYRCVSPKVRHHVRACKLSFLLQRGWDEAAALEAESMRNHKIKLRPHIMNDVMACLKTRRLSPDADKRLLARTEGAVQLLG